MSALSRTWLQCWFPRAGRRSECRLGRRLSPRRPSIEQLEDRLVPATFDVLGTADGPIVAPTATGQAGVYTVANLRSAIQAANNTTDPAGNIINLTVPGVYSISLAGTPGETDNAAGELAISGLNNGTSSLTIQNASNGSVIVDGGGLSRVFDINPDFDFNTPPAKYTVTLSGFTIENGRATDTANPDSPNASGGGIRDQGNASLILNNMTVTSCSATADGGGIAMENTVSTPWTLTLNNTTVSNNHAGDAGGGVETDGSGKVFIISSTITGNSSVNQGAGIWLDAIQVGAQIESANLTVQNTLISDNDAIAANNVGGGIGNAGNGTVSILDSTLANNSVNGVGGGFGDENGLGTLIVLNSTIANNDAIGNGGGIEASGPSTTINDSTVTGNISQQLGGGINVASATFVLNNTIVAGNFSNSDGGMNFQGTGPDVAATVTTGSGSFIGIGDIALTGITNGTDGNQIGTAAVPLDPKLGALQDNGGPTPTESPLPGSSVIDSGVNSVVPSGTSTDQRGFNRVVNKTVDVGAVEYQPSATTTTLAASGTSLQAGQAVTLTATVTGQAVGSSTPQGTVTFFANGSALGTVALSNGVATLNVTPPVGTETVSAQYNGFTQGDLVFSASASNSISVSTSAPKTTTTTTSTTTPASNFNAEIQMLELDAFYLTLYNAEAAASGYTNLVLDYDVDQLLQAIYANPALNSSSGELAVTLGYELAMSYLTSA